MRQAVRVAQRVFERHVAAERVTEHGPLLEAEPLAKRVGVGGQVLPGHRGDRRPDRAAVAAVVVEDQRELIGQAPERQHRPVIGARAAVHEQRAGNRVRRPRRTGTRPGSDIVVIPGTSFCCAPRHLLSTDRWHRPGRTGRDSPTLYEASRRPGRTSAEVPVTSATGGAAARGAAASRAGATSSLSRTALGMGPADRDAGLQQSWWAAHVRCVSSGRVRAGWQRRALGPRSGGGQRLSQ